MVATHHSTSDPWAGRLLAALDASDLAGAHRVLNRVAADRELRDRCLDQLAQRAALGSEPALTLLLEAVNHHGLARAGVRRVLVTETDVDDVTQETLASMIGSIGSFSLHRGRFVTWLFEIARNRSIDFLRRQRVNAELDDDECGSILRISSLVAGRHIVHQALQQLPDPYQRAVTLRDIEQLSYRELSEKLGLNLNTAKSHVARGREQLSQLLASQQR